LGWQPWRSGPGHGSILLRSEVQMRWQAG